MKKYCSFFYVNIISSLNNTIITVTNKKGGVFFWKTSGSMGFKGSKKSTPYASQKTAEFICKELVIKNIKNVWVNIKGAGLGRDSALRAISSKSEINIIGISDKTPDPHNGCRPPKKRRI